MKKSLIAGTLFSVISFVSVARLMADPATPADSTPPQAAAPDTKSGTTPNSQYGSPVAADTSKPLAKDVTTVPSGKRHRTHRKMNKAAATSDDSKTIQSGDVTPAK